MARTVTSRPRVRGSLAVAFAGLLIALTGCATPVVTPPPSTTEGEASTIPVIIDADFDLSDLAAIAVLLRDPKVDVLAIAIDGTGVAHCQAGRRMAGYLLAQLGRSDIPFGCGREEAGPEGTPFPAEWRARADADFGLAIPPTSGPVALRDAVSVIKEAVAGSESAPTIVALGPLTDLEDAFAADGTLADRLAGIQAMLGTITAPGNVLIDKHLAIDQLEWNAFADPSAVAAVFDTDVPVTLVPLDATDDVPVPADLPDRLASATGAGAALVRELLVRNPGRLAASDGQQLWDELTALTLTNPELATWSEATVTVDPHGRIAQDDAGRSIRYATGADRVAVENALVDALSRGAPRGTPFQLAGQVAVTFDGTHCAATGHTDRDGPTTIDFTATTGKPAGVALIGAEDPHTWQDIVDLAKTPSAMASPPSWLIPGPVAIDTAGDGKTASVTGDLGEGFYGPICFDGTDPGVGGIAGSPFEVGSGAIGP